MKRIAMLVAGLSLIVPASAALASSSTCQAYSPQLCGTGQAPGPGTGQTGTPTSGTPSTGTPGTAQATPSSGQTVATTASSGTLPFTGLDVALLAAGGGMLIAAGVVV